jgi:hypothetical protein
MARSGRLLEDVLVLAISYDQHKLAGAFPYHEFEAVSPGIALRSLYTLPHSSTYAVDVIELPPSPAQVIPSEKPSTRLRIERLIPLSELILSPRHGDSNEKGPKKNNEPASKQTDAADPQ